MPNINMGLIKYKPHQQQIKFHISRKPYRLYGGAKGGGKSLALLMEAINWCDRVPGCNVLLLRRTMPELEAGLMRHFEMFIDPALYGGVRFWNRSEGTVTFPNGSKLYFKSCQHEHQINKFQGHEYVFIGIDEATEFTYGMYSFLTIQNRCPFKIDRFGKSIVPTVALSSNPGGIGNDWVRTLFIGWPEEIFNHVTGKTETKLVRNLIQVQKHIGKNVTKYDPDKYDFIPATVHDNPAYKDDEGYLEKLDTMSEAEKARYLYGSWDVFVGQFFEKFDPALTKMNKFLSRRLVQNQKWQPKWIGIDWGFENYAACFIASRVDIIDEEGVPRDAILIFKEIVVNKTGERDLARLIYEACTYKDESGQERQYNISDIYLSPDAFSKRGSQNTIAEELGEALNKYRLPYPVAADDDRVGGWRLMDEMLSLRPDPELRISEECEDLLMAIPQLIRDDVKVEDIKKIKTGGGKIDDIADGIRYTLKSHLQNAKTPAEVERQRLMASCGTNQERYFADLSLKQTRKKGNGIRFLKPRFRGRR